MPPKNKPMKPVPKTRMGYAKNAWDEAMKRASSSPMGSGTWNPVTYAAAGVVAGGAALEKKDPFAKPLKKPAVKSTAKPAKKGK